MQVLETCFHSNRRGQKTALQSILGPTSKMGDKEWGELQNLKELCLILTKGKLLDISEQWAWLQSKDRHEHII